MTYPIPHPPPTLQVSNSQTSTSSRCHLKSPFQGDECKYTLPPCEIGCLKGCWCLENMFSFFLDKKCMSGFGEGILQRSVFLELCTRMKWKASFTKVLRLPELDSLKKSRHFGWKEPASSNLSNLTCGSLLRDEALTFNASNFVEVTSQFAFPCSSKI